MDTALTHNCTLPEESVAINVMEVVEFIAADGSRKFAFRYGGDMSVSCGLGLLTLLEHDLIQNADFGEDEED